MARYCNLFYLAAGLLCAGCVTVTPIHAAEFYAIVERDGTVALCLKNGALLFADRCEGSGRLTIVQPIKDGTVIWQSAQGTISIENTTSNAHCALSHAAWDHTSEKVISTGRKITTVERAALLEQLVQMHIPHVEQLNAHDITAFALDLDGDSKDETVFVASNLGRLDAEWQRDHKTRPYVVLAGIIPDALGARAVYPTIFQSEHGDYSGPTDAIGTVTVKGVVSIAPGTGELALLTKGSVDGGQTLIRYRNYRVQAIDTIEYTCN